MDPVNFFYTLVDHDGSVYTTLTPGNPEDEGLTWVRGQHEANAPVILALLAASALAPKTWTTADGRTFAVTEMHSRHIVYAIRKFARRYVDPARAEQLRHVIEEAKRRNLEVDL